MCRSAFRLKDSSQIQAQSHLQKYLTTFDLVCVGIGSTVGSGVFVLTGVIAHDISGSWTPLCYLIGCMASLLSAWSYAELSLKYPQSGSSYIYTFSTMGELPAYISAACLTLEYGISGVAVARSWGDKVDVWTRTTFGFRCLPVTSYGALSFSVPAAVLQALCVMVLLMGLDVSQKIINAFTVVKIILVSFIIISGFILFDAKNLTVSGGLYDGNGVIGHQDPSAQSSVGGTLTAILTGASTSFFGFVGYDEVCCLSGEALTKKSIPYAVFGTIVVSTVLYILASLSLCGMQNYHNISESGFSQAFFAQSSAAWHVVGQITAIGELIALPLVALISFMAQPRLLYAMAQDKLMPALFARINADGNFTESLILTGICSTIIALVIPFRYLESVISAGILINFNMTNVAYILMRGNSLPHAALSLNDDDDDDGIELTDNPLGTQTASFPVSDAPARHAPRVLDTCCIFQRCTLSSLLIVYNALSIVATICVVNVKYDASMVVWRLLIAVSVLLVMALWCCGRAIIRRFDNANAVPIPGSSGSSLDADSQSFTLQAPWFPLVPLLGIVVNWFLLAQIPASDFACLAGYFALALLSYVCSRFAPWAKNGYAMGAGACDTEYNSSHNSAQDLGIPSSPTSTHSMLHCEDIDVGIVD